MIEIRITGEEASRVLKAAERYLKLSESAVALSEGDLSLTQKADAKVKVCALIAAIFFGEDPLRSGGDRLTRFKNYSEHNSATLNIAMSEEDVNLVIVPPDQPPIPTINFGKVFGYSKIVRITEAALTQYRDWDDIRSDDVGEIRETTLSIANSPGPPIIYLEGIAFLPWLKYRTQSTHKLVEINGNPKPSSYLRQLFRHIATFLPSGLFEGIDINIDPPDEILRCMPRFVCGINPEEDIAAALVGLLGFTHFGFNFEHLRRPRFFLDLQDIKNWRAGRAGKTGAVRMVQLIQESQKDETSHGKDLDLFEILAKDIVRWVKPKHSSRLHGTTTPILRRRLLHLTTAEAEIVGGLKKVKDAFNPVIEKNREIFLKQLEEMAGMDFGNYESKKVVVSLITRIAGLLGSDFNYEDGSGLHEVYIRVAKNGQVQLRSRDKNRDYIYSQYSFPLLTFRKEIPDKGH